MAVILLFVPIDNLWWPGRSRYDPATARVPAGEHRRAGRQNSRFHNLSPFCHCCSAATPGTQKSRDAAVSLTRIRSPIVFQPMKFGASLVSAARR
jgi:hypothetical protein